MTTTPSSGSPGTLLQPYARVAGALSAAAGGLVLVGWALDIPALKSVLPGVVTMKANTALAFLLAGVSLWLAVGGRRAVAIAAAGLVGLIGLLTLSEYVCGWDLGIDQLLFSEPAGAVGTSVPGRMASTTALNFLLLGSALAVVHVRRGLGRVPLLAVPVILVSFLAFLGYLYGIQTFTGIAAHTKMAVHTSVIFVVLGTGILVARGEGGLTAIIVSESTGGLMARRLLPAAVLVPAVLGWLRLQGERLGWYDTEFGLALFVLANMAVFVALIGWNASLLFQADQKREAAEGALRKTYGELETRVQERTRDLTRVLDQVREGFSVLAGASSEILAAAAQLSSTAAASATALAQTAATMEEVRQTAQVANHTARDVAERAQKTAQVSQSGRRFTDETLAGMTHIRQQMDSIADSMVRLSEQTEAISQIIAAVDDLAAQSNILAVNAAIEAAKAGEQGKGFTVVAQEVKSLAEQSKQATAQVRAILGDIQKATGAAVLATEQGAKAVETGVKQSAQAGETIQALADSVTESAHAATQIAASSQQQLIGVDQVASAVESIKQASTQNAASAKQMEASVRDLNELGRKLKALAEWQKAQERQT